MAAPPTVTVYNFRVLQTPGRKAVVAPHKAPRDVVAALGGEVIDQSAEEVAVDALDSKRLYRRQATGWGDLGPR